MISEINARHSCCLASTARIRLTTSFMRSGETGVYTAADPADPADAEAAEAAGCAEVEAAEAVEASGAVGGGYTGGARLCW